MPLSLMEAIADLQVHSRFSRAIAKRLYSKFTSVYLESVYENVIA